MRRDRVRIWTLREARRAGPVSPRPWCKRYLAFVFTTSIVLFMLLFYLSYSASRGGFGADSGVHVDIIISMYLLLFIATGAVFAFVPSCVGLVHGLCPSCGYEVHETDPFIYCPECGAAASQRDPGPYAEQDIIVMPLAYVFFVFGALCVCYYVFIYVITRLL